MDAPVVSHRQVPITVEVPQIQSLGRVHDAPVSVQRQIPMIGKEQKTADVQQTQCMDKVVDMPVAMPQQTPVIQRVQKMVEVPQILFIDKLVDALVSMQRQVQVQEQIDAGVNLNITGVMPPHRKRKGSGIFLSHRLKAGMTEKVRVMAATMRPSL